MRLIPKGGPRNYESPDVLSADARYVSWRKGVCPTQTKMSPQIPSHERNGRLLS